VDDDGGEQFRRFVLAETAGLLRAAWLLTGDRMMAEDLLQTALATDWWAWGSVSDGSIQSGAGMLLSLFEPERAVWPVPPSAGSCLGLSRASVGGGAHGVLPGGTTHWQCCPVTDPMRSKSAS
jgi:hypothetical protein